MSVLVYTESPKGSFKKAAYEAVTYGKKVAELLGTTCHALVIGQANQPEELGKSGADKVLTLNNDALSTLDSQVYSNVIAQVATQIGAKVVIMANTSTGKTLLGRVAVRLGAGSVSGVKSIPTINGSQFLVSKSVFSGKATATFAISSDVKVLSLMGNAIPVEASGSNAPVEAITVNVPSPKITVTAVKTIDGTVPLPEASLVVSAGRGLKGPENWGIIEDLATTLGATTACSRPVADSDWRPHHEHVGQTGVAIRPNLYIAVGISGAIQHLAGVNNSKVIVVINKDNEAPFFKAADYGVCGDLFEIVPKLTDAFKRFKENN